VDFAEYFQKSFFTTSKWNFFEFLAFSDLFLVVYYLKIERKSNSLNYINFSKPYLCNIQNLKTNGL